MSTSRELAQLFADADADELHWIQKHREVIELLRNGIEEEEAKSEDSGDHKERNRALD